MKKNQINNTQKTILLTGGTGFLGANLAKSLINNNYKVIILKRSFSDTSRIDNLIDNITFYDIDKSPLEKIFNENNINIIIHCATDYGFNGDYATVLETNINLPLDLLILANKYKTECFINSDTYLNKRISPYSMSKNQFLEWYNLFNTNGIKSINLVLHHLYGNNDNKYKLIPKLIFQLQNQAESIALTSGDQLRNFLYIDDAVNAFLVIIKSLDGSLLVGNNYSFTAATDQNTSIKDLVNHLKILTKNTKTNLLFGALPYRKHEEMNPITNTSSLKSLGWKSSVSLNQGLKSITSKTINKDKSK